MTIDYERFVATLNKPGEDIVAGMTTDKAVLLHMVIGVAGEAGELVDAIKKHAIYGKPIDLANVREELGDIEFFLEGLRQTLSISREETIAGNITKLQKRYDGLVYSDQRAIDRADKL